MISVVISYFHYSQPRGNEVDSFMRALKTLFSCTVVIHLPLSDPMNVADESTNIYFREIER